MTSLVLAVIPARYGAERLPGKPLLRETGMTLIEHCWRRVRAARRVDAVLVATDDPRIAEAGHAFGAEVAMTSPTCRSGTDRVAEAVAGRAGPAPGLVLNVQGDEPELDPGALDRLVDRMERGDEPMGTLACPFRDAAAVQDPNRVKVVADRRGRALYFSRSPLPFRRDPAAVAPVLLHIGVYAFRPAFLASFARLSSTPLEAAEKLEQLRVLEHGHPVAVEVVETEPWAGIDTRADYEAFCRRWKEAEAP
jgi:3-deoxy-manno-octulosonate cytidylyltransferase (CMP-KDO synthetase)